MHSMSGNVYRSAETTVLATVMVGLEDFIRRQGGDARTIFNRVGLSTELAQKPNDLISLRSYCCAIDEAVKQTGNDNFGLWFGDQFSLESLGMLGFLLLSSPTLGEALGNLVKYFPVHQKNSLVSYEEKQGIGRLSYRVVDGNIVNRRQDAELSIALFLNIFRHALGDDWSPCEIHFEHARPENNNDHRKVFASDTLFSRPMNAIYFKAGVLDNGMPQCNAMLFNVMQQSLEIIGGLNRPKSGLVSKVKDELISLLASGNPRLEEVALRMNMPGWTLQRRLAEDGKSFKEIVEETRKELACYHLQHQTINISGLATLLGYTEVSAFSRAFQRWYGVAPGKWRAASGD
ncbi:AraC family transcriptional regulator [Affinibrenneria salicis]|uniref:AraC family transcriptional regulator n=1 Tax=Affinibrenneria salicis TaxID=2590031 RepID=A0A5J5FVN0_9GAMM|nr:AraC family transcriptional regulator [Affinibrenneria salicis]KAA8996920.1 AraC family transcriptional regulator [Affinibrenneria salicis]